MDYDLEMSLEGSQDDEGNKDAARALMRVKQKLDGYEEGEMRSINGQVISFLPHHLMVVIEISRFRNIFLSSKLSRIT